MAEGMVLSWEEAQRLALPPDTTMLVPPPPEPAEVPALAVGPPPTWLDDAFVADPEANRAAAEQAEYGPGPVRLAANLIAFHAVLEYAKSPPKADDEKKPTLPPEPKPDRV